MIKNSNEKLSKKISTILCTGAITDYDNKSYQTMKSFLLFQFLERTFEMNMNFWPRNYSKEKNLCIKMIVRFGNGLSLLSLEIKGMESDSHKNVRTAQNYTHVLGGFQFSH